MIGLRVEHFTEPSDELNPRGGRGRVDRRFSLGDYFFFFFLLISFWSELPSKTAGDAYVCIHLHAVQKRAALRAGRGAEHRGGR